MASLYEMVSALKQPQGGGGGWEIKRHSDKNPWAPGGPNDTAYRQLLVQQQQQQQSSDPFKDPDMLYGKYIQDLEHIQNLQAEEEKNGNHLLDQAKFNAALKGEPWTGGVSTGGHRPPPVMKPTNFAPQMGQDPAWSQQPGGGGWMAGDQTGNSGGGQWPYPFPKPGGGGQPAPPTGGGPTGPGGTQLDIEPTIKPRPIFDSALTQQLANQQRARHQQAANPAYLMSKMGAQPGVGRGAGQLSNLMGQIVDQQTRASTAGPQAQWKDAQANAGNVLKGQIARENEAQGMAGPLINLLLGQGQMSNQQQAMMLSTLSRIFPQLFGNLSGMLGGALGGLGGALGGLGGQQTA